MDEAMLIIFSQSSNSTEHINKKLRNQSHHKAPLRSFVMPFFIHQSLYTFFLTAKNFLKSKKHPTVKVECFR